MQTAHCTEVTMVVTVKRGQVGSDKFAGSCHPATWSPRVSWSVAGDRAIILLLFTLLPRSKTTLLSLDLEQSLRRAAPGESHLSNVQCTCPCLCTALLSTLRAHVQRRKNVRACEQCLCKFFQSLDKICDKFYAVLSQRWVMLRFHVFLGGVFGFKFSKFVTFPEKRRKQNNLWHNCCLYSCVAVLLCS